MPTTNIHTAKHLDGRPLTEVDIRVGLEILAPGLTGGVLHYKCVAVDAHEAIFMSLNKDWPNRVVMEFNEPSFTLDEFILLYHTVIAFSQQWRKSRVITQDQRELIKRAASFNYVMQQSYTQVSWTTHGLETFNNVCETTEPLLVETYWIRYDMSKHLWQLTHDQLVGICGEFPTKEEAIDYASTAWFAHGGMW